MKNSFQYWIYSILVTNEAHRKHKPKHLQIVDAIAIRHKRPIILPSIEEHIPKITQGLSYKLTNIQLKICSDRKNISTTSPTTITESNDEKFILEMTLKRTSKMARCHFMAVINEMTNQVSVLKK